MRTWPNIRSYNDEKRPEAYVLNIDGDRKSLFAHHNFSLRPAISRPKATPVTTAAYATSIAILASGPISIVLILRLTTPVSRFAIRKMTRPFLLNAFMIFGTALSLSSTDGVFC